MPDPSYYQILGVDPQCSEEEIEDAYRSLLSENFNQDGTYKPGAKDTVQVLNQAYVVLSDPVRRKQYDYELFWGKKGAPAGEPPSAGDPDLPDWLKASEGSEKNPSGDDEVVEWLEMLGKNQAERKNETGGQRSARVFILISLVVFLIILLVFTMMALAK